MYIHGFDVQGDVTDEQTRCIHYNQKADIVAIKFKCCQTYYACYKCHKGADHIAEVWEKDEFDEKAILCGACGSELTINQYLNSDSACPVCEAMYNPHCKNHLHLYFNME